MPHNCRWCTRFREGENNQLKYVLDREFGSVFNSEPYWFHKVQLWGVGSQVLKQCDDQRTNISIASELRILHRSKLKI
jgi:hypothetical protein